MTPAPQPAEAVAARPSPHALWRQAGGDQARYIALMKQHGHLVPRCATCGHPEDGHDFTPPRDCHATPTCDCETGWTTPTHAPAEAVAALTSESEALLADFGYHTPDCDVTDEDNCTCDLRARLAAIEAAALTRDHARCEALRSVLSKVALKWAPHSGSCCTFDSEGKVVVTPESCKCGDPERSAQALLGMYGRPDEYRAALAPTVAASDVSCIHLPGHPDDCEECDCAPSPATEAER